MKTQIIERNGRWQWVAGSDAGSHLRIGLGVVTFATPHLAELDLAIHLEADSDESGRFIVPAEHLDRMISAFLEQATACAGVTFGSATWHAPDDTGCNWEVRYVSGTEVGACMAAMRPHIDMLRHRYAMPNSW